MSFNIASYLEDRLFALSQERALKVPIFGLLAVLIVLPSCVANNKAIYEEHDRNGAEAAACEHLAELYRTDRINNPTLCSGYDENGWPVSPRG